MRNEMKLEFDSRPENEGFARVAVAAFLTQLSPTMEEVEDVKTAVSEAVTNAVIHGYAQGTYGQEEFPAKIWIQGILREKTIYLKIRDEGCGIADVKQAMEPLFTTRPELERSGMGFAFMEAFMDHLTVESVLGEGTTVSMDKEIGRGTQLWTIPSN